MPTVKFPWFCKSPELLWIRKVVGSSTIRYQKVLILTYHIKVSWRERNPDNDNMICGENHFHSHVRWSVRSVWNQTAKNYLKKFNLIENLNKTWDIISVVCRCFFAICVPNILFSKFFALPSNFGWMKLRFLAGRFHWTLWNFSEYYQVCSSFKRDYFRESIFIRSYILYNELWNQKWYLYCLFYFKTHLFSC